MITLYLSMLVTGFIIGLVLGLVIISNDQRKKTNSKKALVDDK